jgi:hypothetical protein
MHRACADPCTPHNSMHCRPRCQPRAGPHRSSSSSRQARGPQGQASCDGDRDGCHSHRQLSTVGPPPPCCLSGAAAACGGAGGGCMQRGSLRACTHRAWQHTHGSSWGLQACLRYAGTNWDQLWAAGCRVTSSIRGYCTPGHQGFCCAWVSRQFEHIKTITWLD